MTGLYIAIAGVTVLALILLAMAIRVFKQYERGMQFRLGKLREGPRGPGLVLIISIIDRIHRVSLRIVTSERAAVSGNGVARAASG
jgi:regulator of protease activity HflC (stomatin/prohibitin superfamily)